MAAAFKIYGLMKNGFDADPATVSGIVDHDLTIHEILSLFVVFGGHLVSGLMENCLEAYPAVSEIMIMIDYDYVWRLSCFWFNEEWF